MFVLDHCLILDASAWHGRHSGDVCGISASVLPSPLSARIQKSWAKIRCSIQYDILHWSHKIVDRIIFDKTTQYIISLMASRLSNTKLPSPRTKESESSRSI